MVINSLNTLDLLCITHYNIIDDGYRHKLAASAVLFLSLVDMWLPSKMVKINHL